jgi:hypothetical protein
MFVTPDGNQFFRRRSLTLRLSLTPAPQASQNGKKATTIIELDDEGNIVIHGSSIDRSNSPRTPGFSIFRDSDTVASTLSNKKRKPMLPPGDTKEEISFATGKLAEKTSRNSPKVIIPSHGGGNTSTSRATTGRTVAKPEDDDVVFVSARKVNKRWT